MMTIQQTETVVRTRVRGLGAKLVTHDLPGKAVCAYTRAHGIDWVVVDVDKPHAWGHAERMLVSMERETVADGQPS